MLDPKAVSTALLETVSAMADGHEAFESNDVQQLDFGDISEALPPTAVAFSQVTLPVTVDGENYCVVAYKIAK